MRKTKGIQRILFTAFLVCAFLVLAMMLGVAQADDENAWSQMESPTTTYLNGIWGSSSGDVFAVGEDGTILHYDGTEWSTMTSPTIEGLRGVWGSSSSDVFAVGYHGTIIHYDGASWSTMTSNTNEDLTGVWGSSSSDVFAVGFNGTILHYDGTEWSTMTSPTTNVLSGVWGSSSSDVFAVGAPGIIIHYDGTEWSTMTSNTKNNLTGVWGSSTSDVFAAGWNGTILHYDGTEWSTMTSTPNLILLGVWGSSSSDVFAVGFGGTILHYDGTEWSTMTSNTTTNLIGISGCSASDVFAVGWNGAILHYTCSAPPTPDLTPTLITTPDTIDKDVASSITVTVANNGAGEAGAFEVKLYADWSPVNEYGQEIGLVATETVSSLPAGATIDVAFTWTPEETGVRVLKVVVDPANAVAEEDETNNALRQMKVVQPYPGRVIHVNETGWWIDGGEFNASGYPDYSVEDAVDHAADGDTVFIHSGYYHHAGGHDGVLPLPADVTNLTLKGEGADVVTLDFEGISGSWISIYSGNSGAVIEGIKIVNATKGIELKAPDCIIRNCVFEGITFDTGIWLTDPNTTFMNNVVSNATGTYSAVDVEDLSCTIVNNTIENSVGAAISLYGEVSGTCKNNTVTKNNLTSNAYAGIELYKAGSGNKIYLNNFVDNGVPVTTSGTTAPAVTYWNSTEPIEYTYGGTTYTNYLGNYWGSDYTGTDADGDGIGDTPYVLPDGLGTDNYPLIAPFENYTIAEATPAQYTLTVTVDPAGSGTVDLDPAGGTYDEGTEVTLTATPAAGYAFDHWSGDLSGSTNPETLTMDADKNVTAHFVGHPDLTLTKITLPENIYVGEPAEITVNIANTGTDNAGAFVVELYAGDLLVDTQTVASLDAGANTDVVFTWTPSEESEAVSLRVKVDSAGAIDELDEDNNDVTGSEPATVIKKAAVFFSPADITVEDGDSFIMDLKIRPGTSSVAGAQFDLAFDPAILQVTGVTEGSFLSQDGANTYFSPGVIDNTAGTITGVAGAITTPGADVSDEGVFAVIAFEAKGIGDNRLLELSNVIVGDKAAVSLPVEITGASVTVTAPATYPVSGQAVYGGDQTGTAYAAIYTDSTLETRLSDPQEVVPGVDFTIPDMPQGTGYCLCVFIDSNNNGARDETEAWGSCTFDVADAVTGLTVMLVDPDLNTNNLPDYWEALYADYNNGAGIGGSDDDADHDGYSNEQELINGTDPTVDDDPDGEGYNAQTDYRVTPEGWSVARTHGFYRPGAEFKVTISVGYSGDVTALGIEERIPEGWTYVSAQSAGGMTARETEAGTVEFAWLSLPVDESGNPVNPFTFSYILEVPEDEAGDHVFSGTVLFRTGGAAEQGFTIPETTTSRFAFHSADYNPADWKIDLSELLRVIQIYNVGAYHCDVLGEDGYNPGEGDYSSAPHSADYNPEDGEINLSELLRVIQIYNVGSYHVDPAGEDGFSPGPGE